jgi:hypothetical protein
LHEDKITVMGFIERGGKVRTEIVADRHRDTVPPMVCKHVQAGAALYSDELGGYKGLHGEYKLLTMPSHTLTVECIRTLSKISGRYSSAD